MKNHSVGTDLMVEVVDGLAADRLSSDGGGGGIAPVRK